MDPPGAAAAPAARRDRRRDAARRPVPGCGWSDSSHELQLGLLVTEHPWADVLANGLPLASWLELRFGAWEGAAGPLPQPA
jgi:hypothetical protein